MKTTQNITHIFYDKATRCHWLTHSLHLIAEKYFTTS